MCYHCTSCQTLSYGASSFFSYFHKHLLGKRSTDLVLLPLPWNAWLASGVWPVWVSRFVYLIRMKSWPIMILKKCCAWSTHHWGIWHTISHVKCVLTGKVNHLRAVLCCFNNFIAQQVWEVEHRSVSVNSLLVSLLTVDLFAYKITNLWNKLLPPL